MSGISVKDVKKQQIDIPKVNERIIRNKLIYGRDEYG